MIKRMITSEFYCDFDGKNFNYCNDFKLFINNLDFETSFLKNFEKIKKSKSISSYLFFGLNGKKLYTVKCFNYFILNIYKATKIVFFEIDSDFDILKNIIDFDIKHYINDNEIYYDYGFNFNSNGWEVVWLYSVGFNRKNISNILKISLNTVNVRLYRFRIKYKFCNLESLVSYIKFNGLIFNNIPKRYIKNQLINYM